MPAAVAIPALIGAGGSLGSALIGSRAAGKAADQQSQAMQKALDFQNKVYDQQIGFQQPFIDAGQFGIGQLMQGFQDKIFGSPESLMPSIEEARQSPGYQFAQQQGMRGVMGSAAARGGALSGGALKALQRFGTGLADQTYQNVFNRNLAAQGQAFGQLMGFTGLGESAIQNVGNVGMGAASNIGSLMGQIGNAQAAGTIGKANAWGGLVGDLANIGQDVYSGVQMGRMQRKPEPFPYDATIFGSPTITAPNVG